MLSHNTKVSIRSFRKNRTSFFINYIGLVGGLVTVLFIYLWVNHEFNVDQFHENDGNIYRLVSDNGGNKTLLNSNPYFAWDLEETIPEVEYVVNSCWGPLYSYLELDENSLASKGEFGSDRFFELFSYPLLKGDPASVLNQPNAIVLSESMAMKLFKSTDIIGKQLEWRWYSHEEPAVVTGIFKDLPKRSSEQFDYVLNFKVYEKRYGERLKTGMKARTYVKLADGASQSAVNQKIHSYVRSTYPEFEGNPAFLIDYAGYYLQTQYENGLPVGGRIDIVKLFVIIGLLVLFIACVNFMNLSTARAALRMKEIGVRKTMGAVRRSLISQFLTESSLISLLAGITSTALLLLLFPFFERLLDQQLYFPTNPWFILGFISIVLFTGLISGSYPALYLSRLHPLKVLKGSFAPNSKDHWLRKGLVVFQFSTSLVLIVAVLVVYNQMQYMQDKSLGYENEYIINFRTTGMSGSKQRAFLDEARRLPGVEKASGISHALFGVQRSTADVNWQGKDPDSEVWFEFGHAGYDMFELLAIALDEGRFFSRDYGDESSKVVINQATKELMGLEQAIGEKFEVGDTEYQIIGVTEDFHFQSLHEEIKPTFFLLNEHDWYLKLALRIKPDHLKETLAAVENSYTKINPGVPFQYSFHDQDQAEMYEAEQKVSTLIKFAAGLAILISSLGLFGLVSFVTERKSKEMSIRKVLGASSISIFKALSKDFIMPLAIASILGIAISAALINKWLDQFAYRVELTWWFFVGAVSLMVVIALITSLSQILKSITANPIESLKDD